MYRSLAPLMLLVAFGSAIAAQSEPRHPALTIYRSDSDALFDSSAGNVAEGYAVVHEQRALQLNGSRQSVVIGGLPSQLDTEAVVVEFDNGAHVLAQRVLSGGDAGALAAHRGERVSLSGEDGRSIADGILVSVDGDHIGVRQATDRIVYVHDYAVIAFPDSDGAPGSTLQLVADGTAGATVAHLTYPTSGLGWRAAYSALLGEGSNCSLQLDALASIANRSGRDYPAAQLKLIAGSPNLAKTNGGPRPMMKSMMVAARAPSAPDDVPEQAALGDYRIYAVDGALDLPDASVTQVPLYASREIACRRAWVIDDGSNWVPSAPNLAAGESRQARMAVAAELSFTAADNLPGGLLRVVTRDRSGNLELLGSNRMGDTAKGLDVDIALGVAFELSATRERTIFSVDKAARELDEGFHFKLTNSGDSDRTVTLREHPNRWRTWTLQSSSQKPAKQAPDTLEFMFTVPRNGSAALDYAVRYAWAPGEL